MQQSWWQEIMENESYRVERFDDLNGIATVLTISVGEAEDRHPFFLTVADLDWPTLLANFAEPVVTRNGEDAAMLVHAMLLGKLQGLMALDRDNEAATAVVSAGLGLPTP
jgi:hypothetical protein